MKSFADNTFSAIVTDPPYELGFMGKKWDSSGIAFDPVVWQEALRVLDPFLGSGTTALASLQLGIPCTGIEKEADHIEIIKARLTSVTRDQDVSLSLPGMRA